jgi:hypothetical protein
MKRIRRIAILATAALMLTFIVASAAYAATLVGNQRFQCPDRDHQTGHNQRSERI